MKQSWTRLSSMVLKLAGDTRFMEPRFDNLFLRHHQNASEIIVGKDGHPLAAIYFSAHGLNKKDLIAVMRLIRMTKESMGIFDEEEDE